MNHKLIERCVIVIVLALFPLWSHASHPSELKDNVELQAPSFEGWLAAFRQEALVKGISQATVDKALAEVKLIKRVIKLDRNQPEFKLTFQQYLDRVAPQSRVKRGQSLLKKNYSLLTQIQKDFGIQPRFIVALWGMETDFGRLTGGFNVLDVKTPGQLDADIVRKHALKGAIDLKNQYFLKKVLIDNWDDIGKNFQNFLMENKLSSHMLIIAQKN